MVSTIVSFACQLPFYCGGLWKRRPWYLDTQHGPWHCLKAFLNVETDFLNIGRWWKITVGCSICMHTVLINHLCGYTYLLLEGNVCEIPVTNVSINNKLAHFLVFLCQNALYSTCLRSSRQIYHPIRRQQYSHWTILRKFMLD